MPPLPRSSTFSPGNSSANAVGLPHPSEARAAATGIRKDVMKLNNLSHVVSLYCAFLSNASRSQCARFAPAS
jgi:hypothetical protein